MVVGCALVVDAFAGGTNVCCLFFLLYLLWMVIVSSTVRNFSRSGWCRFVCVQIVIVFVRIWFSVMGFALAHVMFVPRFCVPVKLSCWLFLKHLHLQDMPAGRGKLEGLVIGMFLGPGGHVAIC